MSRNTDRGRGGGGRGTNGTTGGQDGRRGERRHILLVEDNRNLRLTTARMLEHLGYQVTAVGDGPAAVEECRRNPPDAAILDMGLPGISGREVLSAIRELAPNARVVLCSGDPDDLEAASRGGVPVEVLVKPYDIESLSSVLNRILAS